MKVESVISMPYKGVVVVDRAGNSAIIEGTLLLACLEAIASAENLTMSQILERSKEEIQKFFEDPTEEVKELTASEGA